MGVLCGGVAAFVCDHSGGGRETGRESGRRPGPRGPRSPRSGSRRLRNSSYFTRCAGVRICLVLSTASANALSRSCASAASLLVRSEEHTSELQSHSDLVCRLLLEKKKRTALCARASTARRRWWARAT